MIKKLQKLMLMEIQYCEVLIKNYLRFTENQFTEDQFCQISQKLYESESDIFAELLRIETNEKHKQLTQLCINVATDIDNLCLYNSESGVKLWNNQQRTQLMNLTIKQYNNDLNLLKSEYEITLPEATLSLN